MKNVVIIGSNGLIGSALVENFNFNNEYLLTCLNHDNIDICNIDQLNKEFVKIKPDVIINTSAYHNLKLCEENPEKAFEVNALGCSNLSLIANEYNSKLLHYSTDYVFDGLSDKPYIETDYASPLSIYGITKLAGESAIIKYCKKYFILRVSGVYSEKPSRAKGTNFVLTILDKIKNNETISMTDSERLTPTYAKDVAIATYQLLNTENYNLYHATNDGSCTWFEFTQKITDILGVKTKLIKNEQSMYPSKDGVERPKYSVLKNNNLEKIGIYMRHWTYAIEEFIKKKVKI